MDKKDTPGVGNNTFKIKLDSSWLSSNSLIAKELYELEMYNKLQDYMFNEELKKGNLPASYSYIQLMTPEELIEKYGDELSSEQLEEIKKSL